MMKDVCKRLEVDTKTYKEASFLAAISKAKDQMITPEEYFVNAGGDMAQKKIAEVYKEYQTQLRKNNALDFDDLLCMTVQLFQTNPEVLESYQNRFRYIMVDEYQDTNMVQFQFIHLLAQKYKNLCVVGDDDQSIYKFRGANIQNILGFEQVFPDTKVIKLEQNYRSTGNILDAANTVIENNTARKKKTLWTEQGEGEKIRVIQCETANDEAEMIVQEIKERVDKEEFCYKDCALLYRTNAQSRILEEQFIKANIPYKVIGGINFYARKEIKDLLSYLKTIENGKDDLAVRRIINVPKRGIGSTTIDKIQDYALAHDISFFEALKIADKIPTIGRSVVKLEGFVNLIRVFQSKIGYISLTELLEEIIKETGYRIELEAEGTEEALGRLENIDELISKMADYEENTEDASLSGFLEEVALIADVDNLDDTTDYVVLMTLHSAKGLEFPKVFLCGLEDGLFPSYLSVTSDDPSDLEEERRLCYVGITRAMESLTISAAKQRMYRGETQYRKPSRFLKEVPKRVVEGITREPKIKEMPRNNIYYSAREAFRAKPFESKTLSGNKLEYEIGDRVFHIKFGTGIVLDIKAGGRDYEVTVDFEKAGTKKMFASFAKLKKLD